MCVWCEVNGKEVNSKCGKIASSLIVRHTILGGIGVIQHVLKHQNYLRRLFSASITRLRSERAGTHVGRDCKNQRPRIAYIRGDIVDRGDPVEAPVDRSSDKGDPSGPTEDSGGDRGASRGPSYCAEAAERPSQQQGRYQGRYPSNRDQPRLREEREALSTRALSQEHPSGLAKVVRGSPAERTNLEVAEDHRHQQQQGCVSGTPIVDLEDRGAKRALTPRALSLTDPSGSPEVIRDPRVGHKSTGGSGDHRHGLGTTMSRPEDRKSRFERTGSQWTGPRETSPVQMLGASS